MTLWLYRGYTLNNILINNDEAPKVVNFSPEQNERYVKMIDEYIKIKSGDNFPKSFSMFMYILAFLKEVFYNKKAECSGYVLLNFMLNFIK